MFVSGGPTWRLRFFWRAVHGNRSAMLVNVSPHKEEKISLVRQVCDDCGPWPVVFPSGIQPAPFCPCGNVHNLFNTQPAIFFMYCSMWILQFVLSPDCCINPCPSSSSFYSCIECSPQRAARSPHNCLFHPPPCLRHSDGHLGHLLQKDKKHKHLKKNRLKIICLKNPWSSFKSSACWSFSDQTCFVMVAYSLRAGDVRTFSWSCLTALHTWGVAAVTNIAVGRQIWKNTWKTFVLTMVLASAADSKKIHRLACGVCGVS